MHFSLVDYEIAHAGQRHNAVFTSVFVLCKGERF